MNGIYCAQAVQVINYLQMTQIKTRKQGDTPGAFSY